MINVLSDGLRYRRKRKYNDLNNDIMITKIIPEGKKSKHENLIVQNICNNLQLKEENKNKTIKNKKNIEFENNNKEMIIKEVDQIIKIISNKEKIYNEEILPNIINKIVQICNKNISSKIRVANCFTDNDFYIDERFFI